ncbi:hypothetical protein CTAYLR_006892 [Chrysophaeum taylorii]|uniref:HSF-type DNA-binding domain-containing protein n=1 Tax=Chrysophaeum taylorii TaxID=2483200 RepID=A0AAD7UFV3_9STRA|nr:hypothetical protein CTAYLR_006892 [Chrysophaeum taylorii]
MEGNGRATTAFMRQLKKMFEEIPDIIWDRGAIIIPDPAKLEKALPRYYKTAKFSSFQRQLNNFGYHRSYTSRDRLDRNKSRGVCYHKVAGAPACTDLDGLLALRPLVRRKKREMLEDADGAPPRRRPALSPAILNRDDDDLRCLPFPPRQHSQIENDPAANDHSPAGGGDDMLSLADAAKCLLSMNDACALLQPKPRQWI